MKTHTTSALLSAPQKSSVKIRMDQVFSEFNQDRRDEFLNDLSELLGLEDSDVDDVLWRSGCVIFRADVLEVAARRLFRLWKKSRSHEEETFVSEYGDLRRRFEEFKRKWNITAIDDGELSRIFVGSTRSDRDKVVFVHGFTGGPESFGKLPDYLSQRNNIEPIHFDYESSWGNNPPSLIHIAYNFLNFLEQEIPESKAGIVAHSMGGLLVQKALVAAKEVQEPEASDRQEISQYVRQITFVATPHYGCSRADFGAKFVSLMPFFNNVQIEELSPDSIFISELVPRWRIWHKEHLAYCNIRSIICGNDSWVPRVSAQGLDRRPITISNTNHFDIIKPPNAASDIVVKLDRILEIAGVGKSGLDCTA